MSHKHEAWVCEAHGAVTRQCRCPGPGRVIHVQKECRHGALTPDSLFVVDGQVVRGRGLPDLAERLHDRPDGTECGYLAVGDPPVVCTKCGWTPPRPAAPEPSIQEVTGFARALDPALVDLDAVAYRPVQGEGMHRVLGYHAARHHLQLTAELREELEGLKALREAAGDLVDALHDELKWEVERSDHVKAAVTLACERIGPDYRRAYVEQGWL
jgi:hypothetical protein